MTRIHAASGAAFGCWKRHDAVEAPSEASDLGWRWELGGEIALDLPFRRRTVIIMFRPGIQPPPRSAWRENLAKLLLAATVVSCLGIGLPPAQGQALPRGEVELLILEFIQPTNQAVFSTRDEIPIVLRAVVPGDAILTADLFVNQQPLATAAYCCPFCPCPPPMEGQETILQIPVPWDDGLPPDRVWQGWTNVHAGRHTLTAEATSVNGVMIEAGPVSITVLDLTLNLYLNSEGAVTLVIPQGSLVEGGYDLEVSEDLRAWTRLGAFQPGDVATFYFDEPPANTRPRRFYRSVYYPPRQFE
jgi:hypothetical protein